jgi:glycyl-tRNA synthetase beta chain
VTSERRDFLVEIGTEELPPKALSGLEQAFAAGIRAQLQKFTLSHAELASFATPRRLAVLVRRLAAQQPEQNIRRRGPPVTTAFDASGQPTRAAAAFAQSCGTAVDQLQRVDEGKGAFLYFIGTRPGTPAMQLLPQIVQAALDALPIPRRMHWGAGTAEFVRPVHWIVMLYGKEVVPATLLETPTGNLTHGHRFHAPKPLRLSSPAVYARTLQERGYVVADFNTRREQIRAGVTEVASTLGGAALISPALLDEVTALVEWPVPLAGRFDERFLSLPREVLISTLQDHQRYFPVESARGELLPGFITVSNIASRDPDKVREGNERVVRPRLADAAFFWEQDRKQTLAARVPALDSMTYQARLGSLGDRRRRVMALAGEIAAPLGAVARSAAERAAELCKCDLLTAMVGEFPELQGIMGTYYARADGEPEEIAVAIRQHYLPRAAGDALPASPAGLAVGVADKLDTLTGIFAINEKPSGNKDPFGLRRAAIGLLRILIEKRLELDLQQLIGAALRSVRDDIARLQQASGKPPLPETPVEAVAGQVYEFIMERLRAYYLEGTAVTDQETPGSVRLTTEMFDAVLATRPASPLDFDARLKALAAFLDMPEATSLAAANKRIVNILRKSDGAPAGQVVTDNLREPAEIRLYDAVQQLRDNVRGAIERREYASALGRLAQLRTPVDDFFDQVMVMDENPQLRANRLALLGELHALFGGIADLSRLPG